jgi:hypothetical protein
MTKIARNVFLVVFALSTMFGLGSLLMSSTVRYSPAAGSSTKSPALTPGTGENIAENEKPSAETGNFAVVSSLATSLVSLIGFVSATLITWRKEKRESDLAEMERKKLELELEKSRLEIEELKRIKKK